MKKLILLLFVSFALSFSATDYTSYDELIKIVDSLLVLKPEIIMKKSYGVTPQGRELFAVKISDNTEVNEPEPEISFDAGTHGNEVVAQEVLFRFMRELVRNYDTDTLLKRLVDTREIWMYPLVSPDGRMALSRNTRGINLNRDWGFYWSPEFRGELPFQLVETRAAAKWILENRFTISQTNHDGTVLFAYHWGFANTKSADSVNFTYLGNRFEVFSPYISVGFYSSGNVGTGSMFLYGATGSIGFTMEVHGTINPVYSDSIINLRYSTQRNSMIEMVERASRGVTGFVRDASTNAPVQATILVRQSNGVEVRPSFSDPVVGNYWRFLAPGNYTISVTANGYAESERRSITVTDGEAVVCNFALTPHNRYWGLRMIMNNNPGDKTVEKTNVHWLLGAADKRAYSIGSGGHVVVDFGDTIRDISGVDFAVRCGSSVPEGYRVDVAEDWIGPWTAIDTGSGSKAFDLSGKGVSWFRYVRIFDDEDSDTLERNAGLDVDAVEYFVDNDLTPPSTPSGLAAVSETFSTMRLNWSPSTDAESDIASYEIFRDGALIFECADTFYLDAGLASGESYEYQIRAKNSRNLRSVFVNVSASTARDTSSPVIRFAYATDSTSVVVRFNKPVDSSVAVDLANYSLSDGISVISAECGTDSFSVALTTTPLAEELEYEISVDNIKDRLIPPNYASGRLTARLIHIPGLVGLWRFDSFNEDTVFDASGNNHYGVLLGGSSAATDGSRSVLALDGIDDGMEVKDSPLLNFARNNFTISAWAYFDTLKTRMGIVEKAYNSLGYRFLSGDADSDRLRFVRGTTYTTGVLSNDLVLVKKKWLHLAAVVDSGTVSMYVNGQSVGSGALAAVNASSASNLFVGMKGFTSSSVVPFKGKLDNVLIVNRALAQSSIERLYGNDSSSVSAQSPYGSGTDGLTLVVSPNPFNPSTYINVVAPGGFYGELSIYNTNGKMIRKLSSYTKRESRAKIMWDGLDNNGSRVASGVYVVELRSVDSPKSVIRTGIVLTR